MKRKIITYTIGILGCIIIDAAFVATAIHHEAPVSYYILMCIFISIVDIGFIYKDTTLNKLILWEGTKWVNLDGTELAQ